jgi:Subtilase family/Secretion system C-terminal sorting domain
MKRSLLRVAAFAIFLALLTAGAASAQVKGDPPFGGVAAQPDVQKSSTLLSPDLKKLYTSYTAPRPKIAESLKKPAPGGGSFTGGGSFNNFLQIRGDKVVVDITVKEDIATTRAELQKMGATITAAYGRMISAIIPIAALPQLEAAASIRFARPAYKPMHVGRMTKSGAGAPGREVRASAAPGGGKIVPVISQGDTAQLSYLARKKFNVDGKGVKVGVLSDSYNNLGGAAIGVAHGELPGPANPFTYKQPVQVLEDLDSGGTDEGRAMMEIVHDVAPGAGLAFHTADNGQADFAQGIVQLANHGCSVIADDVFYYAEPFFQDGIIAQAVDQAKSQGVAYFSAAGNEGVSSYESVYRPTPVEPVGAGNGTAHNFSGPGDPPRYFQPVFIPPGGVLISSFQWDESSFSASGVGCNSDLDIYLLDGNGNIVAAGNSDNLLSGDPIEVFGYQNTTSNVTFYLVIVKFAGPDPGRLKYILYNDAEFYLTNPAIPGILAPTLVGHAKADGAIATGAAFYLQTPPYGVDTPVVEGFSSEGGVANYFDISGNRIAPLIRKRPDIVAPDGVNTSFFDPFGNGDIPQDTDTFPNFFGTSAAAPHAAGAAALMINAQRLGTLTPSQIRGILSTHTWDMDDPNTPGFDKGYDFATGYGLIKVVDAVGEVNFPNAYIQNLELKPLCSPNPGTTRNWQISNPNPFDVPVTWLVVGSQQHGSLVVSPGDTVISTPPLNYHGTPFPTIAMISWEDNFGFSRLDLAYSSSAVCGRDAVSAVNSDQLLSGQAALTGGTDKPAVAEVYPNPSTGIFRLYLSTPGPDMVTLGLYSVDGRQLQVQHVAGTGVIDIDATSYRSGVYFLKVIQGGEVKTIKLVKL